MKALYAIVGIIVGLVLGIFVPKPVPQEAITHHVMTMEDMMESMNGNLRGKTGAAFDRAFLKEMIMHHEGAVEMARTALQSSQQEEIADLASSIILAQENEIAQMKEWQRAWFGIE